MVDKAESPFLMAFGFYSVALPVLLSIFDLIRSNLQAIPELWQSKRDSNRFQFGLVVYDDDLSQEIFNFQFLLVGQI